MLIFYLFLFLCYSMLKIEVHLMLHVYEVQRDLEQFRINVVQPLQWRKENEGQFLTSAYLAWHIYWESMVVKLRLIKCSISVASLLECSLILKTQMHKFMVMWMNTIRRLYNRRDDYASVAFVVMDNGFENNTNQFGISMFRLDFMYLPPCGSM